ncbi:MAG: transketolase [Candidatus Omnitrophica bacterium]|nr:transketolase [Candidatus Omnitrophota bacterium]
MSSHGSAVLEEAKAARRLIAEIIHKAGASHIGTAYSCVEILRAIYRNVDVARIMAGDQGRDRVILSKGHGATALYTVMHQFGLMGIDDLRTYGQNGSLLSGHVSHFIPRVEHSTGALGHGLSVGVGAAIGLRGIRPDACVYVVTGDGELHEGSNWEACMLAAHLQLNNLRLFVDVNNLCGIAHTSSACCLDPLTDKFRSFGFETYNVDGHDEDALAALITRVKGSERPVAFVCRTIKGKGISFMEGQNVWHYRPPNKEAMEKILVELA